MCPRIARPVQAWDTGRDNVRDDSKNNVIAGARGERALIGAPRPAPRLAHRSSNEPPAGPPPSGWSLPRPAALALLAAAPAAAQTDVWTATLTPADFGSGLLGCNNASATSKCSTATVLSDDDFTYDSTDYSVTTLYLNATAFTLTVDADITDATNALTVVVGSTSLAFADAIQDTARTRTWFNPSFSWTAGTAVSIRIPDTTPPELTSAAVAADGNSITVTFDESVDQTNLPAAGAFSVAADGAPVTVSGVSAGTAAQLVLALAAPGIRAGQVVTLGYTDPTDGDDTSAVQDTSGNDAVSFSDYSVTNNSIVVAVPSNWSLTPTGLAVGAQFRLLFLSSTKRDGSSSDIADYHAFIQTRAAAGHADIRTYSTGFRAVGCTADTDARDTTYTTYTSTDKGVPIYWLNGAKAADQYEDFYDGTWDDEVNDKNESGTNGPNTSLEANYPLTGCNDRGTEYFDRFNRSSALAKIEVMVGRPNSSAAASHGPLSSNTALDVANTVTRPMYGLSAIFQVAADTTPPTLTSADVEETNGLTIYLEFSEDLQLSNPPLASAFTLTVDGSAVTGFSVALPGSLLPQNAIWLRPPTAIRQGQAVVVTYTDPTAGNDSAAIQDTTGNDAADFTTGMNSVPAVINNSTVANAVLAGWSLTPTGLAVGDQFRLLFLSSTKRDATATDIATYNTFIQTRAAAGHTDIQAYSAGFRVVGCTAATDARDNTETTYISTAKGVPIYWLDGAKAADEYEDFYDGSWDDEANDKNESGTDAHDTSQTANYPWTGCNHDGTEARQFAGTVSHGLGTTVGSPNEVRYGRPDSSTVGHGPLGSVSQLAKTQTHPLYGLSALFQVATTVVVNNPPAFSADTAARSVAENTAAGQNVGAALTATDDDGHTLTYTLEGADAASFDILSTSGQIQTKAGVTYNHEATSTYTVIVKADDSNGGTDTVTVTITVTDVDEPPGQPAAPSVSAMAGSTTSLDVTWTAPTNTGPAIASYDLQYRAGTSGNFTNGPQNVTGTSAAIGSLAADTSYEVQVRATNAEGDGDWSVAGTGRTTANNPPTVATAIPDQSATAGTAFSYVFPANTFSDADTGDTLSYTATKTDDTALPTWLAFTASTRTFAGTPQAADAGTVSVKVTASDGNGGSVSDTFDITVIISVPSNWTLKPTALATGDKFRLLFLSSTKSAGSPTDIATYNTFVQGLAAAGHADIRDYSAGFRAVGCTAAVDARDNTKTTYTMTDKGVPVYWLNGAKAADQYEDFYDGSWDDEANDKNESGTDAHDTSQSVNWPITGCNHDGTESFTGSTSRALGASRVHSGGLNSSVSNVGPLHHPNNAVSTTLGVTRPLYGLSAVFQVAADTTPPTLTSADVEITDALIINLVFSEDLQLSNPPALSAFTVTVDGSAATVSSVGVPGSVLPQNELWLQLSTAIRQRQAVVVTYTDATSGDDTAAIQDTAGNDAATFTTGMDGVPAVTNNSTVTNTVPADWSLIPTGLSTGDKFRLLFLSSTKRNASSTDIATYNTFIQTRAAAGHTDIRDYSADFRAVGCTADTDARDNTSTTYTASDKGVPIYWLDGTKAADEYEDFYDGSWDDEANDKNESGTDAHDTSLRANYPWTGCDHDGTEAVTGSDSFALGTNIADARVGRPNFSLSNAGPLNGQTNRSDFNDNPLYGLSEVFQVAAAVVVPNNPPAFSADTAARSVAENTAAGQNVGAALTATDDDGHTLTYTLEGTDAASFGILSASGQIRTRTGVTYNHEAKSTHTVVVKADDGNGGTDTVTVTITVTDVDEPPGQPAAPTVSATAGSTTSLDVTWTAPTNTGPAIASYDLQYRAGTSGNFTNGPQNVTGTSAAIGSLAADTSYEVQVRATNAEGDGDWSVAGTGRTTASVPGAPTGLTATASGATQIDLSWSAPGSTGGSAITGYKIEVSPNGTSGWTDQVANTNSTATTYAHTGLAAGDTRHYRVSAINTNGAGTASNVDSATTVQVPAAVSNVVAVPVPRTTDSLQVSWSAPDNAGKPALTGYDVRYREDVNWTTVRQDAPSTSVIIADLRSSKFYDVQVRALNADGSGPWSSTAEAVTSPRAERVYANHPLIPADLGPGDSFRLLFITSGTKAATRTGIHTYHNFASSDAIHIVETGNLVSEWGAISLLQTPLVSTPGADARLHTDTTWTETDRGMPIYWLNGARVADDYADFYDGVWADEANPTNGLGNPHSLAGTAPWTGTDHDGTELFNGTASRAIGQASVSVGGLGSTITGAGPLNGGVIFANTQERPIYGLWHVLVVDENLRLVTNLLEPDSTSDGSDSRAAVRAQLFTTGPNSSGYGIGGIEVANGSDTDRFLGTVALYTTDTDGNPDLANGLHATLSLERAHEYTWDLAAPAGTVLKPNTTYALVFQGDGGTYPELWTVAADGENVPADGWSLANTLLYHNGTSWAEDSNGKSLLMEMVGPQLETEGPALVSATVGAAGNAVTLVFDEDVVLPSDSAEALTFLASLASAFAVTAHGAGVAVSGLTAASAESDQLTIVLSGVILQGQAVTLTYTDPTAGDDAVALQDVLGNETPTFTTGLHGVPAVINNSAITVLTTTVPGAPTGLTATASGATAIDLSWSAPASTGGSAITGYKIEVSPNGTSGWTDQVANTNSTATTYAHTGLAAGDTRYYRVSAINTNGTGTASNVDSATTGTSAPGAPTGLTATASGTTAIDLSWSAPGSTGGSAITGYKIEVSANGTSGWTDQVANTNSTATTYAHTGLAAGDTRYYRVSAINTNGTGTASNVDSATTGTSAPGAPTGLTATASGTTAIDLSWSAPGSTGGSAITGYKIEVSSDGGSSWSDLVANTSNTTTTYAHTGLAAGDTRHYRVSAINTNGTGTASNVASATTGTSVPGAPTGLTATASGTTAIDLSWSAPGSTGGSAITGYKIESSSDGGSSWSDLVANTSNTTTTYAHTGLTAGDTRHYRVSAINTNGTGTASNVASATTGTSVPGAPTGLTATASGTTAIDLSWSAPGSTGGSAITGYKIESSSDGGSSWSDLVANTSNTTTTYAHTGLTAGATRHYRVSAINANGTGDPSNVANATTGQTTVTFGASSYTAAEGGATATVAVQLSAAASATVTIPLTKTHRGGATAADYSGVPSNVTFTAGQTRRTFTVTATDDADKDGGESVQLGFGTLPAGYAPGARRTATVTLVDDDATLIVNFGTERHTTVKVRESDTVWHRFIFSLSTSRYGPPNGNPQQPVTIPLVVTHRGGTTTEDYEGIPSSVTFAVGKSVTSFRMRTKPDRKKETGEGLRLDFGPLPAGVRAGTWGPYETIAFVDQVLPGYTVLFGAEAYTATEGGAPARVSIHLSEPVEIEPLVVRLVVTHVGATAADYTGIPKSVRFGVGEQTQTITVKATDDTDDDDGESVTLSFVNDPNGRVRVRTGLASATVALADNDGPRRVTVSFGAVTYTATEGGADATVRVELDAAPGRSVTVPLTKAHLGGATAADYSGIPMNVTFAANQTSRTFAVMATADDVSDGGESVSIGFGTLPEGVFAGSPAATTVTLADGSEQRLVVNFGSSRGHTVQVREGARRLRLNVLLDSSPRRPVTIPLVVTHVGGATEADYAAIPESVTFAAGQTSAHYYVRALPDEEDETGEGLQLDFGPLPPGVRKGTWGPYETIDFLDPAANLSVSGTVLTVGFPGALDGGSTPSPRDFVVSVEAPGGEKAMAPVAVVAVEGSDVFLQLARQVAPDDTVTLSYLADAMHPIRDEAGSPAAPLTDAPVRNQTPASGLGPEAGLRVQAAHPAPLAALLEAAQVGAGTGRLDLSSRHLTDITALAGLTGLRELDLRDNAIEDLWPLAGLRGLEALYLSGNQISDLLPLAGLRGLKVLDLAGNRIEDLWPLSGLTELRELDLADNAVADLGPLAGLAGLEALDLAGNRISDVWGPGYLTRLERLNLADNSIEDLRPLARLTRLEVLLLDRNRITDVLALSPMAELANLGLAGNPIANLWPLEGLGQLHRLDLSGNAAADPSALGRVENLRWLWLDPAPAAELEAAPGRSEGRGAAPLWTEPGARRSGPAHRALVEPDSGPRIIVVEQRGGIFRNPLPSDADRKFEWNGGPQAY